MPTKHVKENVIDLFHKKRCKYTDSFDNTVLFVTSKQNCYLKTSTYINTV